jgi:hypothetical protein
MATLGNKKVFSGMAGNVVFRNLNGKQIVQARPSNVKHSESQKKSAAEFGNCSRWAKQLRWGLTPLLAGMTDTIMYQRFTAAVHSAIKQSELPKGERTPITAAMHLLEGFEFNTHSPFADHFKSEFTAGLNDGNEILITLPAFEAKEAIVFPEYCTHAKLITYVYATNFEVNSAHLRFHSIIDINKNDVVPAQTLLATTAIPAGHFVLVAAKLLFYKPDSLTGTRDLNTETLSPAMVVLAEAVGV